MGLAKALAQPSSTHVPSLRIGSPAPPGGKIAIKASARVIHAKSLWQTAKYSADVSTFPQRSVRCADSTRNPAVSNAVRTLSIIWRVGMWYPAASSTACIIGPPTKMSLLIPPLPKITNSGQDARARQPMRYNADHFNLVETMAECRRTASFQSTRAAQRRPHRADTAACDKAAGPAGRLCDSSPSYVPRSSSPAMYSAISRSSLPPRVRRPATTPWRSCSSRFWLIFHLPSSRVMAKRKPTMPRSMVAT